ncbi:unnamed protein product [Rotaria sp. Silwood2]|nr:unnamed protein product [Rotaria sp. Silwood2]CAF3404002.1 unnamed protein product [Rotaria sp. Silwood2]
MTSSSNNILQNYSNETSVVSAPVSTNMVIGLPTVPIKMDFRPMSHLMKKRTHYQVNVVSNPVAPSPVSSTIIAVAAKPLPHKAIQKVEGIHHAQGI